MAHIYYAFTAALVITSIYRPFITKLDITKYLLLGGISFMIPFILDYNSKMMSMTSVLSTLTATTTTRELTNITSTLSLSSSTAISPNSEAYHNDKYLYIDAAVYFLISTLTVSTTGLFTRWHFPITFVKPNANIYTSALSRNGVSTLFVLLAILR